MFCFDVSSAKKCRYFTAWSLSQLDTMILACLYDSRESWFVCAKCLVESVIYKGFAGAFVGGGNVAYVAVIELVPNINWKE